MGAKVSGSTAKLEKFLKKMSKGDIFDILDKYGTEGVRALAAMTPVDTGKSAASWSYEIDRSGGSTTIRWTNSNLAPDGTPIVIMLQYGHGTGTGGYVEGRDFINPAIDPVFDRIALNVWKEVTSA